MEFNLKIYGGRQDKYYLKEDTIGDYTIQEVIGEGRYGIVYLAVDKKQNKFVVKQLKKKMLKKQKNIPDYEEYSLKKLNHPAFPKFITRFQDHDREGYVIEFIEGELFDNIIRRDKYQFKRDEIYQICGQLMDIIEIMHASDIVHGDIRLPNIIRKTTGELVLIDFGLARLIHQEERIQELDYWHLGDFLLHLYYTTFQPIRRIDRPWYHELDLNSEEKLFLKKLMAIDKPYHNINQLREQLNIIKQIHSSERPWV